MGWTGKKKLTVGRKTWEVTSLIEAVSIYNAARDASGEGALTWPRGRVAGFDISYNGRVWLDGVRIDPATGEPFGSQ